MTKQLLNSVQGEYGGVKVVWRWEGDELKTFIVRPDGVEVPVGWMPQPGSQQLFLTCPIFETLFEGTRGPGKTDALIMDFAQHCGTKKILPDGRPWAGFGDAWRGILFRQTFPQLADVIVKTKKWLPKLFPNIKYNESKSTWHWATGETLRLSYIQREADYWNYHGHEYPWIGFEELTTWPEPTVYLKMMSCCRSSDPRLPQWLRKFRSTTNPSGRGHNWVRSRFNLPIPPERIVGPLIRDNREGVSKRDRQPDRIAIHGHLSENKILELNDPGYRARIIASARNKSELAAWIDGSWDIVAGGMFDDVWDAKYHVLPDFVVPRSWRIDRSFDWGSSAPFSVGWWARSDGTDLVLPDGRVRSTVRGDLFRIGEWYGWTGRPNEGLRMMATDVSKGIIEREIMWGIHGRVKPGVADSSIFTVENGSSIVHSMAKPVRIGNNVYDGPRWFPADKRPGSRKVGWEQVRIMLLNAIPKDGRPREQPGLFVTERCEQFRRTIPVLPRDDKDPDDVDTSAEDHVADETRYYVRFASIRSGSGVAAGLV